MNNPKLRADGGQMIVSRPVATHVWGSWSVTLPEDSEQVGTDERVRQGFSYRIPGANTGLFDRRFVRADVSFDVPKKISNFEDQLDTAAKKVNGGVFFERDITKAGLGRWVPLRDFRQGDFVDVLIWGKILSLLVTSIEQTTGSDGVVGWRVHVGGQMIRDLKTLATKSSEVERQIMEERRQRLGEAAETRSIAKSASDKVTEAVELAGGAVEQVKSYSEQAKEFSEAANRASVEAGKASRDSISASESSLTHSQSAAEASALSLRYSQEASRASRNAAVASTQAAAHTSAADEYSKLAARSATNAEQYRIAAEESRRLAENARGGAELSRASAEKERERAESARAGAETARSSAETDRKRAEHARSHAEYIRNEAEQARSKAEAARDSAEQKRDSAEKERVKAEQARSEAVNKAREVADTALRNQEIFEELQRDRDSQQDRTQEALLEMHKQLAQKVVAGKLVHLHTSKDSRQETSNKSVSVSTAAGGNIVTLQANGTWTGTILYSESSKGSNGYTTSRKRVFTVPFPDGSRSVYPFYHETPQLHPRSDYASWVEVEYWINPEQHIYHAANINRRDDLPASGNYVLLHTHTIPSDGARGTVYLRVGWDDAYYGANYRLEIRKNGLRFAGESVNNIGEQWNLLTRAYRTRTLYYNLGNVKSGDVFTFYASADDATAGRRVIRDGFIKIGYFR